MPLSDCQTFETAVPRELEFPQGSHAKRRKRLKPEIPTREGASLSETGLTPFSNLSDHLEEESEAGY